jgi:DNA-binding GntR family transcriptional regulator
LTTLRQTGAAERAYDRLKAMAIEFEFRPGERINEVIVSKRLGLSRTPLREALNRLESEGFLTFSPKLGFFRRKLDPKEIFDLYELRGIIEAGGARLAAARVMPEQIKELREFAHHSASDDPDRTGSRRAVS